MPSWMGERGYASSMFFVLIGSVSLIGGGRAASRAVLRELPPARRRDHSAQVLLLQAPLLGGRDRGDLKRQHPVRRRHELLEVLEGDSLAVQVRDDPEVERPLRQPDRFVYREE